MEITRYCKRFVDRGTRVMWWFEIVLGENNLHRHKRKQLSQDSAINPANESRLKW